MNVFFKQCFAFVFFFSLVLVGYQPSGKIDIDADRFTLDAERNIVLAKGNVVVRRDGVVIHSEYAEYDQSNEVVFLSGDVVLTQEDMTLWSRHIDVYGNDNRVKANGDVRFLSGLAKGDAGHATYLLDSRRIFLQEDAQVFYKKNRVNGDRVEVDLPNEHVAALGRSVILISDRHF